METNTNLAQPDAISMVLFDVGGTLVRNSPTPGEIYARVGEKYGCTAGARVFDEAFTEIWSRRDISTSPQLPATPSSERENWCQLVVELLDRVGGVQDVYGYFDEVYDIFGGPGAWALDPDAIGVLEALRSRGLRLGIVSNWDTRLRSLCQSLGISEYFDCIVGSGDVGFSKPDVRIFHEALKQSGGRPESTVHVGDSFSHDVLGAAAAGISPIWLRRENVEACDRIDHGRRKQWPAIIQVRDLLDCLA